MLLKSCKMSGTSNGGDRGSHAHDRSKNSSSTNVGASKTKSKRVKTDSATASSKDGSRSNSAKPKERKRVIIIIIIVFFFFCFSFWGWEWTGCVLVAHRNDDTRRVSRYSIEINQPIILFFCPSYFSPLANLIDFDILCFGRGKRNTDHRPVNRPAK